MAWKPIATLTSWNYGRRISRRLKRILRRTPRHVPLRLLLVAPFLLQIAGVAGLVIYLSYRNGEQAVNQLANQVRGELTARIEQELSSYFADPPKINQITSAAFIQGELPLATGHQASVLLRQLKVSPFIYSIYCANEKGEFLGAMRVPGTENTLGIWNSNAATQYHQAHFYSDRQGNRKEQFRDAGAYDPRKRPWYQAAKREEQALWSDVYLAFSNQMPAITASQPVYDWTGQEVVGVCATDVLLTDDLRQFLKSLKVGKTGLAFVIDRGGVLLSSSTDDPLIVGEGKDKTLLQAQDSRSPLVQKAMERIMTAFPDLNTLRSTQQLDFKLDRQRQLVQVAPYQDQYGLDLLIVLVLPEADFLSQIHTSTRNNLILCGAALAVAMGVGFVTSRRISQPLLHLSKVSQTLADGQLDQQAMERSPIREVQVLALSFNRMAHQLQQSFMALEQVNQDLEKRVEERTAALAQRAEQDGLLRQISQRLINQDIAPALHYALRQVGHILGGDRCYLVWFNAHRHSFMVTYQWLAGNCPVEVPLLQDLPMDALPWIYYRYHSGSRVEFPGQESTSPEAAQDYQYLCSQGLTALLLVPMHHMGRMVGWIGLDGYGRDVPWPTEALALLDLVGEMLAMTQARYEVEKALRLERAKSDQLLLNILPQPIADQLKQDIRPIAESFEAVSILFADIVNFTPLSSRLAPTELVEILNQIFSTFDELAGWLGLEKIKTIGDAYMVVAGLPAYRDDHVETIADMALAMVNAMVLFNRNHQMDLQIRVGVHWGPVVAGVIGVKKFTYDLWGDTVNVASRMEALGESGRIQVTEAVADRLRSGYHLEERGEIAVKGKGMMRTYWLLGKRQPWETETCPLPQEKTS